MIGQDDPLGYLFKNRIKIIEISRRIDRITILDKGFLRQRIPNVHCKRFTCRLLRLLGCPCDVDLDDRLPRLRNKPLLHSILTGTRACPRICARICRGSRRRARQSRPLL